MSSDGVRSVKAVSNKRTEMGTGMGDRHNEGESVVRRRTGTGDGVPDGDSSAGTAVLEPVLGRALRADSLDASVEQQVVAAFRTAREQGLHEGARTRRRDDWRPRRSPARRSVKTAVAVFLASLTLGGVAIAAIGSPGSAGNPRNDGSGGRHSAGVRHTAKPSSGNAAPARSATPAVPGRPPTAKDIQAHCRAYPSVKGRGKALESTAWRRFIAAAGGEDNVAAFCAEKLSRTGTGNAGRASAKATGRAGGKKSGQPDHKTEGQ